MTMLGMPPSRPRRDPVDGPIAFTGGHHFTLQGDTGIEKLAQEATAPLSVILQVTKRCDFDCSFCSETLQMPDPTMRELDTIHGNLAGTKRVFLSGGEPLLRRDFPDIVDLYQDFIIGVPTNATRGVELAEHLAGKVAYVNIGFDGPRSIFARVRGDYDKAIRGAKAMIGYGLPVSLSAVVLRSTLHGLPYLLQIADVFDAGKLKLILPLRKGNALGLDEREFIGLEEARDVFDRLTELRATHDWRPAVRMTPWTESTEGHMVVVEPNGLAQAWPVYDRSNLFLPLGNLLKEPITTIWERYPYKANHLAKYLGASIQTADRPVV
ncbi:radical SAM protein [Streptosporangium sp. NPDC002524]|uniref:radical SAM protein n=1 Tax=Streptosporangium sp. NPDC002524 TaxID=3154537 RepID=UPI003320B455